MSIFKYEKENTEGKGRIMSPEKVDKKKGKCYSRISNKLKVKGILQILDVQFQVLSRKTLKLILV